MSDDQITLVEAILLVLFGSGENFKKMTSKEIYEKLSTVKWITDLKEANVEDILKNNEKLFKIDGETYEIGDHGISIVYKINFY